MYDIHCHVLYGVDDGARNIEDSINICRLLANDGVKAVIATPHYMEGKSQIDSSRLFTHVFLLNLELKVENIDMEVLAGMEVYTNPDLLNLYEQKKIITINYKNYMLIELPQYNILPPYLDDLLFNLQLKGIKPVIAHPERYISVIKDPYIVYSLINKGCIMQVNSGSVEGLFGSTVRKTAYILLKNNMVHVVSSDTHSSYRNISSLKNCYGIIYKKFGKDTAENLFINNPYKIINGENII